MKKHLGILFAILIFFGSVASAFSFPGIQTYIPDTSGQYVYYRDYSFDYEAYIGFLYYDEETYAMRYFAPQHPVENAPARAGSGRSGIPKSIEVLFTVNPNLDYTEMTGERFLTNVSRGDTEIVNYLHDLVYEFSARRRKVEPQLFTAKTSVRDDFSQFGGTVTMEYSFDVPIFNLERIVGADGIPLFEVVSVNTIVSSDDTTFSAFSGFPAPMKDKSRRFASSQEKPDTEIKYNTQRILLDEQWIQAADNMYMLGDVAVLVLSDFAVPANAPVQQVLDSFYRNFSLGSQGAYADWTSRRVSESGNRLQVELRHYLPAENAVSRDFKILGRNNSGNYSVLSLTVFDNAYKTNKEYFDAIIKSYTDK